MHIEIKIQKKFEAFRYTGVLEKSFDKLPVSIQRAAKKNYELLKENPSHASLHYKKTKEFRSVSVGLSYRALGIESGSDIVWFWIGSHADYDKIIS